MISEQVFQGLICGFFSLCLSIIFLYFNLCLLPLTLSLSATIRVWLSLLYFLTSLFVHINKTRAVPSLTESLTHHHLCGPYLHLLQYVHVSLVLLLYWGAQNWMQHYMCGLPSADYRGRTAFPDLLVMICLMQPRRLLAFFATKAWLAHVQFVATRTPWGPFPQSCSPADQPPGLGLAFHFVEFHEGPVGPFFQAFAIPLRFPEVINEGVKQYWPCCQPLGYAGSDWSPGGYHATDHSFLRMVVQPLLKHHIVHLHVMGECTKGLLKWR